MRTLPASSPDDVETNQVVERGALYIVGTPIGNRGDLSPRAKAVLAAVDRICAEDTRTSGALLAHFGIHRPMQAMHEHNEDRTAADTVRKLQSGVSLALVSDAGMPLVSDPGYALVSAARASGVPIYVVPGPSAVLAALSVSGLPTDRFVFEGFLPPKAAARRRRLQVLASETRTLVCFESAHRIVETAADCAELFAERRLCVARELTKRFEESVLLPVAEVPAWLAADEHRTKGEFVLVLEGATPTVAGDDQLRATLVPLLRELSPSKAARVAAELTGRSRNELYPLAVELANETA
ncbi:MAG TPA: 16S rRNA (cytidine(1402)-2'-O)-methyltransferase [Nevskiaceae bacterium]|nr:16S rRNA (cytidine(1402)-2'-O)-methyltransferase [Nevskiaceae bacterium]